MSGAEFKRPCLPLHAYTHHTKRKVTYATKRALLQIEKLTKEGIFYAWGKEIIRSLFLKKEKGMVLIEFRVRNII